MKKLSPLFLIIPLFFTACNKIEEEPDAVIPESMVKITRFAIQEYWPLSEGKIDTATKIIDIQLPAWAETENLNAYIELAGEAQASNIGLKEIIVKDSLGGQTKYTINYHKPEANHIKQMIAENDTISFTYNEKGRLKGLKFYEAVSQDDETIWKKQTFETPLSNDGSIKIIKWDTVAKSINEKTILSIDSSRYTFITLDNYDRYNNNVLGGSENLRFTYDIAKKRVYADFRINYAPAISLGGKDGNISKRIIFSDFDGNYTPAALFSSKENYLLMNMLFHHYYQAQEIQLIPSKSLLTNPKKVTIINNILTDTGTDAFFEYQYESDKTIKSLKLNSKSASLAY